MMMSEVVEKALRCLGRGFDVTCDFRAKHCKGEERLVVITEEEEELAVPGFYEKLLVSADIKCDKGDRIRYQSDVLEFNQMSELFNQRSSLAGKIPSGRFNAAFGFDGGSWARDATGTKSLAIDGYFISLFNLQINRHPLMLCDCVLQAVPTTWDTFALARFIETYGTHIIVGLSVGGQDVVYVRQDQSSDLSPSELKQHLDELGDQIFNGACFLPPFPFKSKEHKPKVPEAFNVFQPMPMNSVNSVSSKNGVTVICSRRGGEVSTSSHCEWLLTVPLSPDVINFAFVPITALLKGVSGAGFLAHAVNLYLRYKPPVTELQHFLDFQCHKEWAPMLNDHPLGPSSNRSGNTPSLHFNLMGPKLRVNTAQVIVGRRPVTGMRLHLESKKNNVLAVHLQHLSTSPAFMENISTTWQATWRGSDDLGDDRFYEAVRWRKLSHVCTAPVKYNHRWSPTGLSAFIVTGAQLHVKVHDTLTVLHLRLLFSEVPGFTVSHSKWEHSKLSLSRKSGLLSTISTTLSGGGGDRERQPGIVVDSGVFPGRPPVPLKAEKMLRFVDVVEVCKGPQDSPGHWLVTGAKLDVEKGKIGLHVKFSLLTSAP